ncbi:hypothetical protein THAOC_15717 [Thalassiosira oceanica]|uniref:Uncharacterized protein n=1 Tax=Thalassiosira oceanica TaxID=159749 RepID=K0SBX7_THAOC|nr:hypothetical protein THAOC_15717 [Thalassiosira oceanica]|eukprot:EJK63613.1 hypothetical protein THAOC_15717 [Thalassiosira oceanica]
MGCHSTSRVLTHASTVTKGKTNCSSTTSLHRTAVGNIESRLIDEFTPAAASSDLQIRTRTGGQPTEVPPRCR